VYLSAMNIKKGAIKRVLERAGPEFLNDPIVSGSGVANEVTDDEEARIIAELKPKQKKHGKLQAKSRPKRRAR
jgi:hypothetical protein